MLNFQMAALARDRDSGTLRWRPGAAVGPLTGNQPETASDRDPERQRGLHQRRGSGRGRGPNGDRGDPARPRGVAAGAYTRRLARAWLTSLCSCSWVSTSHDQMKLHGSRVDHGPATAEPERKVAHAS